MDKWNQIGKPIVVLASICVVVTGALAVTNQYTAPKIAALATAAATEARQELMPGVEFHLVDCDAPNISEAYQAEDGSAILTALSKGYGGTFVTMVAFDGSGNIVRVKVQEHAETKGIGDKVEEESFWGQYSGKVAEPLTLDQDIDRVSGATISSKAVNNGVNAAIVGYQILGGTYIEPEPSDNSEVLSAVGTDLSQSTPLDVSHLEDVLAAYAQEDGFVFLTTGTGYDGEITVATSIRSDGVVLKVALGDNDETAGKGDQVGDPEFLGQFQGLRVPLELGKDVDGISGATISSKAMIQAVNKAILAFPEVSTAQALDAPEASEQLEESEEETSEDTWEEESFTEEELAELRAKHRESIIDGVTEFEEITIQFPVENLVEIFQSVDKKYYVITAKGMGYYDLVDMLVVLDSVGHIVTVEQHEPNPSIYTQEFRENTAFFAQYTGKSGAVDFEREIDAVSGATISSSAVNEGVNVALSAFDHIKKERRM